MIKGFTIQDKENRAQIVFQLRDKNKLNISIDQEDDYCFVRVSLKNLKLYRLAKNIVKEFEKNAPMKRRKDEG